MMLRTFVKFAKVAQTVPKMDVSLRTNAKMKTVICALIVKRVAISAMMNSVFIMVNVWKIVEHQCLEGKTLSAKSVLDIVENARTKLFVKNALMVGLWMKMALVSESVPKVKEKKTRNVCLVNKNNV